MKEQRIRWFIPVVGVAVAASLFAVASCTRDPLKEALAGKYLATENNRIISNYCQTCHVHRNFALETHVGAMKREYSVRTLREAEECRDCHNVNFNFFWPDHRNTLFPPLGRRL